MDYKCNLDCPIKREGAAPPCCGNCVESRCYFVTDDNRRLWDDKKGFWSKDGCRLSRDEMPQECKDYDCRKHDWLVRMIWRGKWVDSYGSPIPPGHIPVLREI